MAGSGSPLGINERKEIKRLLGKMSLTKIAERINRSKNCVITEVRLNGGKDEYDPVAAHKRADTVQKEGRERTNALNRMQILIEDAKRVLDDIQKQKNEWRKARIDLEDELRRAKGMNHLLPMIQKLDDRVVEMEELLYSNVKPLYFEDLAKKVRVMEKKIKVILDHRDRDKKVGDLPQAPTSGRYIKVSDWDRSFPSRTEINKFIKERDSNGFNACCFKPGRQWIIDENRYNEWEKLWLQKLEADAVKTEVT